MHLYLISRCCYGEAGWRPPGNSTWVKRDRGPREMFLWGFLLAQVACAGHWWGGLDPQGRAVHASVMQAGVTSGEEGCRWGTEQRGQAGRGATSGPKRGSSARSETSTDKELYGELFFKINKKKKKFSVT